MENSTLEIPRIRGNFQRSRGTFKLPRFTAIIEDQRPGENVDRRSTIKIGAKNIVFAGIREDDQGRGEIIQRNGGKQNRGRA